MSLNSPHGYYQVNNQVYLNKTEALYNASLSNTTASWHFHDQVYSKFDWTKKPVGNLKALYKARAQQIRDKYDYVILQFSGGMDSWTVLHTFLSNNIKVDEVFTRWPRAERKYRTANNTNRSEENLGSEFEYAVVPVLEYLKTHHPEINIVVDDYSECFEEDLEEKDFYGSNQYQSMPTFFRFTRKSDAELEQERKNKKIAVVYGYDKVRCLVHNKNLYACFVDCIGGTSSDPTRSVELFYWTPDFPYIPIMQAHAIKEYLKEQLLLPNFQTYANSLEYREIYQQSCYPDYNINTFQVGKPLGSAVWESDSWIKQYNPRYYESWKWATGQFFSSINDKFLTTHNENTVGFKPFHTPMYLVEQNTNIPEFKWFKIFSPT